jgi:hypothetical protein
MGRHGHLMPDPLETTGEHEQVEHGIAAFPESGGQLGARAWSGPC